MNKKIILTFFILTLSTYIFSLNVNGIFNYKPDSIINNSEKGFLFTNEDEYSRYIITSNNSESKLSALYIYDSQSDKQEQRAVDLVNYRLRLLFQNYSDSLYELLEIKNFDETDNIYKRINLIFSLCQKYNLNIVKESSRSEDSYYCSDPSSYSEDELTEIDIKELIDDTENIADFFYKYLNYNFDVPDDEDLIDNYVTDFLKNHNIECNESIRYDSFESYFDFYDFMKELFIEDITNSIGKEIPDIQRIEIPNNIMYMLKELEYLNTIVSNLSNVYDIDYNQVSFAYIELIKNQIIIYNFSPDGNKCFLKILNDTAIPRIFFLF